jgi:hypothetical protein
VRTGVRPRPSALRPGFASPGPASNASTACDPPDAFASSIIAAGDPDASAWFDAPAPIAAAAAT